MIHDIKNIEELFHPAKLEELKNLCIMIDRFGSPIIADEIFKLYFYINKATSISASLFNSYKTQIKLFEELDSKKLNTTPNPKSEMRFHKSFPSKIL